MLEYITLLLVCRQWWQRNPRDQSASSTTKLSNSCAQWVSITFIFIHSKYLPISDWLKPKTLFTITSCCLPNLERILSYWTNDIKSEARCKLLKQWRQNDVKSAVRCRLLNRWRKKPRDEIVLFLVSRNTKSEMARLFQERGNILNE